METIFPPQEEERKKECDILVLNFNPGYDVLWCIGEGEGRKGRGREGRREVEEERRKTRVKKGYPRKGTGEG